MPPYFALTPAPEPAPYIAAHGAMSRSDGGSIISSPGFIAGILAGCTMLAVLLWVALAVQTRRHTLARAKRQEEAAAKRAAMMVPVIVIQPDESVEFGAKLFRSASGGMWPIEHFLRPASPAAPAAPPATQRPAEQAAVPPSTPAAPLPPVGGATS